MLSLYAPRAIFEDGNCSGFVLDSEESAIEAKLSFPAMDTRTFEPLSVKMITFLFQFANLTFIPDSSIVTFRRLSV